MDDTIEIIEEPLQMMQMTILDMPPDIMSEILLKYFSYEEIANLRRVSLL